MSLILPNNQHFWVPRFERAVPKKLVEGQYASGQGIQFGEADLEPPVSDSFLPFPVVAATNTSTTGVSTTVTTHTVSLPASISAGDLLIIAAAIQTATITVTGPSGWTQLFTNEQIGATTGVMLRAWYKVATGSEGSTVTFATNLARASAHHSYRITGYSGNPEGATAKGNSASADPPNLAPSWGNNNTLWLAAMALRPDTVSISSQPASYTNFTDTGSAAATYGARVGSARRENTTGSENPGTFALAGSADWVAGTIAIKP